MKKLTSKILHYESNSSNKVYILSPHFNPRNYSIYHLTAYFGANGSKLQKSNKGEFNNLDSALLEMDRVYKSKIKKGYKDITSDVGLAPTLYEEYLSYEDIMTKKDILGTTMVDLIEGLKYDFENETPEDSYNEGLKLAKAMKSNVRDDRRIAVAKSIKRFGKEFLIINSLEGEDDVDCFENSIRIKAIIERGSIELKETAIEDLMNRLENGIDDVQDENLHLNLVKTFLPNSKVAEEEIFEIAVCLDNIGMEDNFDIGVGYCFEEDTKGKELIKVFDKAGIIVECDNERFRIEREEIED